MVKINQNSCLSYEKRWDTTELTIFLLSRRKPMSSRIFLSGSSLILLATLVTGCGGGGGDGGTPVGPSSGNTSTSPTTFPLQKAYANLNANGYGKTVNVTGTATVNGLAVPVTGNLQINQSPAITNATFNGQPADEIATSISGLITADGQSISVSTTTDNFYSTSGQPLGAESNSGFCVTDSYTALPTTINIGQTGTVATFTCYSDSTMSTLLGTSTTTYAITAGASTGTANLELIATGSNSQGQQVTNSQTNFQMDTSGNLTFSSIIVTATIDGVSVTYKSS